MGTVVDIVKIPSKIMRNCAGEPAAICINLADDLTDASGVMADTPDVLVDIPAVLPYTPGVSNDQSGLSTEQHLENQDMILEELI